MFSESDKTTLLQIASQSIAHGLHTSMPMEIDVTKFDEPLRLHRATFVTLHRMGPLRGCIGRLDASRPLVADVAFNAFAAAFQDPRFTPLTAREVEGLDLHISVLTTPQRMTFTDEADLLRQLRPGIDGLILESGPHRGTFLPAVWADLPDPTQFLQHLKLKAGLSPDHWSPNIRIQRYTAESVP